MAKPRKYLLLVVLLGLMLSSNFMAQKALIVYGKVLNTSNKPIEGALVQVLNSNYNTLSDNKGAFIISLPHKQHLSLLVKHISYNSKVKEADVNETTDSVVLNFNLSFKEIPLDPVLVKPKLKPDTIAYSGKFGIYDFDFYEDKYILLTAEKNLSKAKIKLADYNGKILSTTDIPEGGGTAKELFHDYLGYTNVICENAIYRVMVYNNAFVIFALNAKDFNAFLKPIIDTINNKLIFSDYWKEYPAFNYYSYDEKNKTKSPIISISNADLLSIYNMEYYYMKPRQRLEAMELAEEYKIDKTVAAALMTGFTKSLFYDPLYAPLFILKDTICIFDHYKDALFHFDKHGKKLDSVAISYNHPKNWREWKRLMLKDDFENSIYAVYAKNGHKYIKLIDHHDGKDKGKYKLIFTSADKVKVRDGYIYYVYRPFESTQEKFLYRERINLSLKD
jgi:hypothetical protein